jgi:hypothetical protein
MGSFLQFYAGPGDQLGRSGLVHRGGPFSFSLPLSRCLTLHPLDPRCNRRVPLYAIVPHNVLSQHVAPGIEPDRILEVGRGKRRGRFSHRLAPGFGSSRSLSTSNDSEETVGSQCYF